MSYMGVWNDPSLRLLWPPGASVAASSFLAFEAIKSYFQRLYAFQDIFKILTPSSQLQGLQFCFLQLFYPRPFKFRPSGLLFLTSIISYVYLLRFFPYFYKRKSQIYKVRCKRNFWRGFVHHVSGPVGQTGGPKTKSFQGEKFETGGFSIF